MNEAAIRHAPLTVVTVAQAVAGFWGVAYYQQYQAMAEQAQLAAEEAAEDAQAKLGDPGPASTTVRTLGGIPAQAILRAARDADMIVVGCRGAGEFSRSLRGSVSTQITHHARCPVGVIPREELG